MSFLGKGFRRHVFPWTGLQEVMSSGDGPARSYLLERHLPGRVQG